MLSGKVTDFLVVAGSMAGFFMGCFYTAFAPVVQEVCVVRFGVDSQ
jgi:hypothetical protein